MEASERIRMAAMLEAIAAQDIFSKKLGLKDQSCFRYSERRISSSPTSKVKQSAFMSK